MTNRLQISMMDRALSAIPNFSPGRGRRLQKAKLKARENQVLQVVDGMMRGQLEQMNDAQLSAFVYSDMEQLLSGAGVPADRLNDSKAKLFKLFSTMKQGLLTRDGLKQRLAACAVYITENPPNAETDGGDEEDDAGLYGMSVHEVKDLLVERGFTQEQVDENETEIREAVLVAVARRGRMLKSAADMQGDDLHKALFGALVPSSCPTPFNSECSTSCMSEADSSDATGETSDNEEEEQEGESGNFA